MPRFESLLTPLGRVQPRDAVPTQVARAGAGKARLPFIRHAPLAGWGPFLRLGSRTAEEEDLARILHTRALVLEDPAGERVALVTIDLHGGSRYVTEKAAALLANEGFHPGNLFLCGTHNHAGPGGLYASPYYDAFAASTGIFSFGNARVGFNQTLADVLAERVEKAVREAVRTLRPARVGSAHDVKLPNWSRQRSEEAVAANFPGASVEEILERFKDIGGGDTLARGALDSRLQTIAAFEVGEGAPQLIGSFTTWGAHCALLSREHEVQSADYFGEAVMRAEAKHPGAVIALAAGTIGDADPLPAGMDFKEFLKHRADLEKNEALVVQQSMALAAGLVNAIAAAGRNQSKLQSVAARLLEDRIAGAEVEGGGGLAPIPQIGIPTLAGSELGTGDIRVGVLIHMREGVCRRTADDKKAHWPRSQSNWDDRVAGFFPRLMGQLGAIASFSTTRPFLAAQYPKLPLRYLALKLESGRTVSVIGLPGEPTTWLAAQLAKLTGDSSRTLVTGVTGDYVGYFTTEAEYGMQQYEGGSTIWGRYTQRWLTAQVKRLVGGEGGARTLDAPHFHVLREAWVTRIDGDAGEMTKR